MENKLPTQQTSDAVSRVKWKEDFLKAVRNNLNYIYVTLMIIANCLLSLLKIEDGQVALTYPQTFWGWVLWLLQIFMTTFIGVMILNAFRRQGIKKGHELIKTTYERYLESIAHGEENANPRSLKEYMRKQTMKDGFSRGVILVLLNLLVVSLTICLNTNSVLALITNIIFAVGFGIKTMLDAEEYVVTELIVWYNQRIELNEKKKELKNGKLKERNKKPRSRQCEPDRVQQTEERGTGQCDSNSIESSSTNNITETIRVSE